MTTAQVRIEKMGKEGQGVGADAEGNVYFVPGAIPGDLAEVEVEKDSRRYRDAILLRVIEPSPQRKNPDCQYSGVCGGCDWLHWDYSEQLKAKENIVRHTLLRAGITAETFLNILPAKDIYGYRNRIQVRREGDRIGFFKKRSHEIVDVEKCLVADERLNEKLKQIRQEKSVGQMQKIELAVDENGEVVRVENRPHGATGFVQINPAQNEVLREKVKELLEKVHAEKVLELFCGNGNLTFAFLTLPHIQQVLAVDSSRPAIEQAKEKAQKDGIGHVEFIQSFIAPGLVGKFQASAQADTIVLDPPRTGAGFSLREVLSDSVQNIIYVSCSPYSFSQDIRTLMKEGFKLSQVQPIDMFPHTRHIELVALLSRALLQ